MEAAKDTKVHKEWYKSTWFTILMLVFLAPVGIFLTWKYSNWSKTWKIIASIASALLFIYAIIASVNAAPTLSIDNAKNGRIETQDSSYKITGTITGANGSTTLDVNDKPAQISNGKYSAVVELKEGDNTIIISAKKKDKAVQESVIIHRLTAAEIQARKDSEAKSKADADAAAAANKSADEKKAAEDAAVAKAAADKKAAEEAAKNVPAEYKSALSKATSYANTQHMSKQGVYDQLVSEYGEKFSAPAAQYAIDNVKADWNANALAKAKSYQSQQSMSPAAIHDQLTSSYGEKFTQAEADYAIQHL